MHADTPTPAELAAAEHYHVRGGGRGAVALDAASVPDAAADLQRQAGRLVEVRVQPCSNGRCVAGLA